MKRLRLTLAILTLFISTFFFLDFANILPYQFHAFSHIQVVPAIMSGSISVLALLFVLTICFGRVYCSIICPLGILQDCFSRISKKINKKKKYKFSKEKRLLRYFFLGLAIVGFLSVSTSILITILDPYSAFGRVIINIFRPLYLYLNNLLASVFNYFGNYDIYNMEIYVLGSLALIISIITLLVIGLMSWFNGRSYCNTICPVGTLLGTFSRYSLMGIRIDKSTCNSCSLCEKSCKSSCIDSKSKEVDNSRCVSCFNCLSVCKKEAIQYSTPRKSNQKAEVPTQNPPVESPSRREFIAMLSVAAIAAPKAFALEGITKLENKKSYKKQHAISPVGSLSHAHLNSRCTSCGLCIAKCPSRVLKPAGFDYGLAGMMQPKMDFEHGFCNFDCTLCSEICPNGALLPVTKEQKHTLQVGKVQFIVENCIVNTDETSCGACSEHCPTQAVSMITYKDDLTIPHINQDLCVGCGGCEYVCPARPFRAIYIEGNPIHQQATPFEEAEKKEDKVDGFGF